MAQDLYGYSFIIPSYNDAEGLQTHFNFFSTVAQRVQLVIVDDASKDDTPEVVAQAQMPDNIRITYHRMAENTGPAQARNTGIRLAEEERVMFLDADDLLTPNFFAVMADAPLGGEVDFVLFKYHLSPSRNQRFTYRMHQVDAGVFSGFTHSTFPGKILRLSEAPQMAATVNFPWNKIYQRRFLLEADITFPDLRMHEDIAPHWQSFLTCRMFAVMDWAPPLITHYEIAKAERATQYVGPLRLHVFPELSNVQAKILAHPYADLLTPVFVQFCDSLFEWMTGPLCTGNGPEGSHWRRRYKEAVAQFRGETAQ